MLKSAETRLNLLFTFQVSALQALKLRMVTSKFNRKTHLWRKLPEQSPQSSPHKRMLLTSHHHQTVYWMIQNASGSEDEEEEKLKPLNLQDDTKFVVFKQLFKLFT